MSFEEHIAAGPLWVQIWVGIMTVVNLSAIVFVWKDVRPRWVLAALLPNAIFMQYLFSVFGYTRILGLSHVIFWTPLLIYLYRSRRPDDRQSWTGRYLYTVMIVNGISLLFDYSDVIRHLLGDGAL